MLKLFYFWCWVEILRFVELYIIVCVLKTLDTCPKNRRQNGHISGKLSILLTRTDLPFRKMIMVFQKTAAIPRIFFLIHPAGYMNDRMARIYVSAEVPITMIFGKILKISVLVNEKIGDSSDDFLILRMCTNLRVGELSVIMLYQKSTSFAVITRKKMIDIR